MAHPDEGLIRAFLDGELGWADSEALQRHCDGCPECAAVLRFQEEAASLVSSALLRLDGQASADEARERVRTRVRERAGGAGPLRVAVGAGERSGSGRGGQRAPWWRPSGPLLKAASIALLFLAVGASALPGSPVRQWIARGWTTLMGSGEVRTESMDSALGEEGRSPPPDAPPPEVFLRVTPAGEGMELALFRLSPEARIRVLWTGGEQVGIFAGEGTRFRREVGRLEAHAAPGDVRVEIPSSLPRVLLTLDDQVLLRKADGAVEILGSVESRSPRELVFGAGSGPNEE